jgi:hypothetical protein
MASEDDLSQSCSNDLMGVQQQLLQQQKKSFVAPSFDLTQFVITPKSYGQDALAILQSQIHHHLVCNNARSSSSNNCSQNMVATGGGCGVTTAISMLHNEIFDAYRDAERHMRNLPYETIELLNVRNRLAGLWCLHAHLLCEFGDNNKNHANSSQLSFSLLLWRQLAASILATATSCALVGNHGWIATALLRLLQNTNTSSQPKRFFQDLAYDGLDRAHARPAEVDNHGYPRVPLSGWNTDSTTDKLLAEIVGNDNQNENHKEDEEQQQQQHNQAATSSSVTRLIKDSFAKLVKSPIQTTICGVSYLFRDPKAALSLCHELNWIADMSYNMPTTGIDAFPLFRNNNNSRTTTHHKYNIKAKAATNSRTKEQGNRKAYVESLTNYGIESLIPNQCVLCRQILGPCDAATTIPDLYGVCVRCRNDGKTIWRTEWFFPTTAAVAEQRQECGLKKRPGRTPKSRTSTITSSSISSGSSSRADRRIHGRLTRHNRETDPSLVSSSPQQDPSVVKEPKTTKKRKFIAPKEDDDDTDENKPNAFKELIGEFELQQAVVDLIAELFTVSNTQAAKILLNMRKTQNAKNEAILSGYLETVRQRQQLQQQPHPQPSEGGPQPVPPASLDQTINNAAIRGSDIVLE